MDKRVPEVRFKGFTDDWEQRKLGEVAKIVGGGTPSTKVPNYWDGEIDWYTPSEIGNRTYLERSEKKITSSGLDNSSAQLLPVGTVLFTSRAGIGKTAILRKNGTTNQGFQSIIPNSELLKSYFIFSLTSKLKKYGEMNGAGSTFIEVSGKQMAKMGLILPSLKEQADISGLLKTTDKIIFLNRKKLTMYESLKKYLLQNLFPSNGGKVPNVRFADFSGNWEQHSLGDIFSQTTNYIDPSEYGVELWSLTVENGLVPKSARYNRRFLVKKNDKFKLVGCNDFVYNPMNITLGAIDLNRTEKQVAVSGYYITMTSKIGYDIEFLSNWLRSVNTIQLYKKYATGTLLEKQRVQFPTFRIIKISSPSLDGQKKIGAFLKKLDDLITICRDQLTLCENIKKYYIQKLFI